jgi:hypothetical protein
MFLAATAAPFAASAPSAATEITVARALPGDTAQQVHRVASSLTETLARERGELDAIGKRFRELKMGPLRAIGDWDLQRDLPRLEQSARAYEALISERIQLVERQRRERPRSYALANSLDLEQLRELDAANDRMSLAHREHMRVIREFEAWARSQSANSENNTAKGHSLVLPGAGERNFCQSIAEHQRSLGEANLETFRAAMGVVFAMGGDHL